MHNHLPNCPMSIKKHRVALFTAARLGNTFAIVAFSVTNEHNAIGVDDPLVQPSRRYLSYQTEDEALKAFTEIVCESVTHGSQLVYNGSHNFG